MTPESTGYAVTPGDLAIVPWSDTETPRIYRVTAVRLGGLGEDGHVEVAAVGLASPPFQIPHVIWSQSVARGVVRIVWREGQCL